MISWDARAIEFFDAYDHANKSAHAIYFSDIDVSEHTYVIRNESIGIFFVYIIELNA